MAEQIISPGVFTRENDLTFLPQGIGAIGAAIVGPTVKGPAFIPTVIRSFDDYKRIFGDLSPDTFVPQTVREYLRNAGSVTVCRVLAGGGYNYTINTNEPVFILGSTETTTGVTFGSRKLVFGSPHDGYLPSGSSHQITINGVDFVPVISASLFNSNNTEVYVTMGETSSSLGTNLAAAINASSSLTGVTASFAISASVGTLLLSGSVIGSSGNITVTTSSIAGMTNSTPGWIFGVTGSTGAYDDNFSLTGGTDSSTTGTIYYYKLYSHQNIHQLLT